MALCVIGGEPLHFRSRRKNCLTEVNAGTGEFDHVKTPSPIEIQSKMTALSLIFCNFPLSDLIGLRPRKLIDLFQWRDRR